jgi:hypothetical protein
MDAINDLGQVLLLIEVCQLKDETLESLINERKQAMRWEQTSGRPTARTKLKK